jgi:ATP-dependent DNA helicase RecG
MFTLETILSDIPGIGPRFSQKLKRLGITTVGELLYHFPNRYEDFSQIYPVAELEPGQQATVQGVIESVDLHRSFRKHMAVVEAKIRDNSGTVRAVWFNQPYLKNVLRPGLLVNLSGKVAVSDEELYLSHPTYEVLNSKSPALRSKTVHTARLVPIYPETRGLTSKGIRFLIRPLLQRLPPLKEWLPPEVRQMNRLPEINQALRSIHFPETLEEAAAAKRRFAFEDLFLLQILNLKQKLKLAREKAPVIPIDISWLKQILVQLPFELTLSQKRSLWEILKDLAKPRPMNRLLQGDVGSGKTVVAAIAAIAAARNGYQSAMMAPTEVLARQHFETFQNLFRRLENYNPPPAGLLTASGAKIIYDNELQEKIKKENLRALIRKGEIKIIIGTHALLSKGTSFHNLGLVIIDEQHRFGVEQRAALAKQTAKSKSASNSKFLLPHFLSMSATPIPRTLMLTIFGDLDISTIEELPRGRKKILTKIVSPQNRHRAYDFIRAQIKKGRQAFVICPRIEPGSENSNDQIQISNKFQTLNYKNRLLWEVKSVKEEFEKLSQKIFPDLKVEMLHGRLQAKTKEEIMKKFREGKIDILVSTSVVEVGVDVPNATIMMIEGAERFGLAQLYQFRGRVGRGEHQSFCFLFTESSSKAVSARLRAIVEAKNGFELAERDLQLRGPGEFLGERQTGLPDIAMKGLQDAELIKASRAAAVKILQSDPNLKKYPELLAKIQKFEKEIHLE